MDTFYFGTNTKMYMTAAETKEYISNLAELTQDINHNLYKLFVLPPYTSIKSAYEVVKGSNIQVGSQSISWEEEGQFTGEISPRMLHEVGASISMIGHSERRHVFHETDEEENQRVLCALRNHIRPLLCVGETRLHRDAGISDEILTIQLKKALQGISCEDAKNIWIAYEPVWAIGVNGIPAEPTYIEKRHQAIKQVLFDLYQDHSRNIPVFYGGSVNNDNAVQYAELQSVDGLFIGRSAWTAENFNKIIRKVIERIEKKERS